MWYYEVLYMNIKVVELGLFRDFKNVQGEFCQGYKGGRIRFLRIFKILRIEIKF